MTCAGNGALPQATSHVTLAAVGPTERVQHALEALGLEARVVHFASSTATAQEAADSVGCELGQIVKTLVFLADGRPTVVLAAGDRTVDTARLAPILGVGRKKIRMGTAEEVLQLTGFETGGVAPLAMADRHDTLVDDSLHRFERVWAAAGARTAVFGVALEALVAAIGGQWASIVRDPAPAGGE
jgi:Cys-tRNA(Pro) deacylase